MFPILCPNCNNNKTCSAPVTLNVVSNSIAQDLSKAVTLAVAPSVPFSKRQVCSGILSLIERALTEGAETAVISVPAGLLQEDLKLTGAVINCRAIQLLAHRECGALKEIVVVAQQSDIALLEAGIKSTHPLCVNCFEAV